QYWLGNAWYAQRDCKRAIEAQSAVTTKYADSPKAPDAWLAMSTCQQEMGSAGAARRSLESLIAKYPSAPAAETARERLKKK
ncbi:MAG: tetratricopeptide repeat protein, partial [Azonexus sp.]|nr:tetratricopeptide repeat protein [Azonexus sp.]